MQFKDYYKKAQKEKWAVGQFNFSSLEVLKGIVEAGQKIKSPIILGMSEGESEYFGLDEAVALVKILKQKTKLPILLHLDHGHSFEYIKKAVDAGFDSVHFDGSDLPLKKNIEITKKVVEYARKKKALVEGEVGVIGSACGKDCVVTNPGDALHFFEKTKVDSLAVSIGSLHGVKKSGVNPHLQLEVLKSIKEKLGDKAFLVLHGGSGTPNDDIKKAISLGITKVNINSDLRHAYGLALKKELILTTEIAPYKYLPKAIEAVSKKVIEYIKLFNSKKKC